MKQVEATCVAKPKPPLNIKDPKHLDASGSVPKWKVMPQDDIAYFCLSEEGYQSLSNLLLDLRNRLETQKQITEEYRKYYEESSNN